MVSQVTSTKIGKDARVKERSPKGWIPIDQEDF